MTDKTLIERVRFSHKLSEIVRPYTRLKPASGGFIGLCVFHREKTPSFHVSDERGTAKCFGCGWWGDVFDFLMQVKGLSFPEAVTELGGGDISAPRYANRSVDWEEEREVKRADDTRRIAHAHAVWLKREPVHATLASKYLRETRAIGGALPEILGYVHQAYCSPLKEEVPALVAPLQDSAGHVTAIQQIFLSGETFDAYRDDDGKRIKRTLGAMRDGSVRLGLPDTVLGLAGSVEDALSAGMLFSLPVWATCGEQRFERVWIPDEIEELVIFADSDAPGRAAAEAAVKAHHGKRLVVVKYPPKGCKDFNDMLQRQREMVV